MDLSKEVRAVDGWQRHRGFESTIGSKAHVEEIYSSKDGDWSSNRAAIQRRSKCPLYCPKPRRVTPFHKLLFLRYDGGDGIERVPDSGYFSKENYEKTSATLSSLSGSWLTFEDGGSIGDLSDVSRRCENPLVGVTGDRQESESLDWSSSPSPLYCGCGNSQKQCERYCTCMSEVGSLSSSFKSHGFLNPEKSKSSLISECTSSSVNIEDFEFSFVADDKNGEIEFLGTPPVRSQNPMVRDSWFRLSTKDLILGPQARSELIRRSFMGKRRHRDSSQTTSLLSSMDKSYAHFRSSPALSV
ncbi:hypothetical protein GpartN1_g4926.t1 [Galdieria partita]|uniref:Uncharacterized protein n=1 Tax=Galdieria partita TaxID=83374 RepID=A0A9C7URW3_9RHOD|nr:hypothetical protein GpartN1_g4926.t1 [Galdieria partita]